MNVDYCDQVLVHPEFDVRVLPMYTVLLVVHCLWLGLSADCACYFEGLHFFSLRQACVGFLLVL